MSVKPWTKFNCYEALCLEVNATTAEIRTAFKAASQRAHPDRGGSHEAQIRVNLAYEILRKHESRVQHDRYWKLGQGAERSASPHFSDDEAVKNLWSGPGGGAAKLSDGKASSGLAMRIKARIQRDRDRITLDRVNRAEMWLTAATLSLQRARWEGAILAGAVVLSGLVGTIYPLAFLGCAALSWPLTQRLRGSVGQSGARMALWDPRATSKLAREAESLARESVARDRERLEVHFKTLETISHLVLTPVRSSDSEGAVLRRLLAVLFVLGLMPERYEAESKRVLLQGESETAMLFYRHGVNQPLALTTIEKILATRTALGARTIYLYNQGGMSKKAGEAADQGSIRWVGLRELNVWARQVWASESSGPAGDILQRLVEFTTFLDQLPV